ncbi:PEP-CTERM sorting domain-containing protein [Akkermansia muciniphila]|uniref:PEP-CTERM sorting domain-containing protein n=1 Tax=Akkermansia muciniphila TaxID=239935 RepID=UPI001BFF66E1|nr:PEP-CTERM sorting domain-containing protein [Akkermansia muciniphila]MBT8777490.1 PEP-CTERM sorting domain-containing protein [Akkermansia muciniphila]
MKKTLSIAAMLCGLCVCANAASMVTEWTGGAGPTEGNTYELGNADNWSNGVPSRGNGQGPDVIFNNSGTVNVNGSMVDTSDGGGITVTGNSNVTVGGTRYMGNVTVGSGSILNLGQVDFKSSDITLDGALNLTVCGIDSGGDGARLVFGIGGIMNVNQKIWGASSFSVSGLLATTSADLTVGEFQFVTRTLVNSAGFEGGDISLGEFLAEDGSSLTKASAKMEGDAADYQGQYYVYKDGNTIKVQYVVGGAVPEPATATLSLLGLAALMLRRRRA